MLRAEVCEYYIGKCIFNNGRALSALAVEQEITSLSLYLRVASRIHPDKVDEEFGAVAEDFFGRISESCQSLNGIQAIAVHSPS